MMLGVDFWVKFGFSLVLAGMLGFPCCADVAGNVDALKQQEV